MIHRYLKSAVLISGFTAIATTTVGLALAAPQNSFNWSTVVNNGDYMPTASCNPAAPSASLCRQFNSYNQPSLNTKKLVVFRARSKGGQGGEPIHGVYTRDMDKHSPVLSILDRDTLVPQPNNLSSLFVEPPSFPRIDIDSAMIATRGNHQPVWEYVLPDGSVSKAGTAGIYANPFGPLITGASKLGAIPEYSFLEVPEFPSIFFDVFPGAPAATNDSTIVFKGNYTLDLIGKTGVYYRDLSNKSIKGNSGEYTPPVVLIANNTHTLIPDTHKVFGSTAPPSAANRLAVFAGFDNEENPTAGGIYLAPLSPYKLNNQPKLTTLVGIGSQVPSENKNIRFNKLGEGVSFDGRFVAFWGAWDTLTKTVRLYCPNEGNKDRRAYCMSTASGSTQDADGWYQEREVPVNQGIFVHDTKTHKSYRVARTGIEFSDFVYWNFSGRAPVAGEGGEGYEDGELARWRSASFVAVSSQIDGSKNQDDHGRKKKDKTSHTAFKARTGNTDINNVYVNPIDGIYLRKGSETSPILTLVETGMDGTLFDQEAVEVESGSILPITEMGIERDGFRGESIVLNLSMGTEETGWAGIYLTHVQKH